MALESGEDNKNQPQEGMSNAELQKLVLKLSKQVEDLKQPNSFPTSQGMTADDVAKIVAAMRGQQEIDYESGITTDQVPEDDFDEVGVRFCSPNLGYVVVDDIRKGHRVKLPFNKKYIFFEYQATKKTRNERGHIVTNPFSAYTSHSKKEIEWLRNYSGYGIFFYENSNDATNVDLSKITKLSRIMSVISNYELNDLNKRCKEHGVPLSDNVQQMRFELAYKMVEKEIDSEKDKTKNVLDENLKGRLLAGKE